MIKYRIRQGRGHDGRPLWALEWRGKWRFLSAWNKVGVFDERAEADRWFVELSAKYAA